MNNPAWNTLDLIAIALMLLVLIVVGTIPFFVRKNKKIISVIKKELLSPDYIDRFQENAYKLLPEAIVILNTQKQITYLNPAAEIMLSCKLRSVMGRAQSDVFKLLNHKTRRVMQGFFDNQTNQESIKRDCILSTQANQTFSVELTLINNSSNDQRQIIYIKNITERKALELQLSNIETYDPLTRMFKRKIFDTEVKQLVDNAYKHNSNHVLVYFSIDQFQVVNDTIGYVSGDNLINDMSEIIKNNINKSFDIVGRMGPNEFAVVFVDRKLPRAIKATNDILESVSEYAFMARGQQYSITMSAGFVVINVNNSSSSRLISEAHIACDLASKRGGNKIVAYQAENTDIQKLEGSLEWVMILKKAFQENLFSMHAQAIHSLATEEYKKPFHHYELLIRLSDENENPISPDEFIVAAEYHSMMPQLDRWVVNNVLTQLSAIPEQNPLPVFAINLSGQSLNDPQFLDFVQREIKSSGVHPQMLCFEITEQVAVEELSAINNFIASLKALGCKFSLDDFGTGVSSYGYLRSLDVDYLKIDGSFVKHIVNDDVARTMVQSINQVGHTMNLKIIAEYVENNEIVEILREMGVDYGQGFEIAKPCPIEEVIRNHTVIQNTLLKVVN